MWGKTPELHLQGLLPVFSLLESRSSRFGLLSPSAYYLSTLLHA